MSLESLEQINYTISSFLDVIFDNDIIGNVLKLFLIMFGGLAAPSLPPKFAPLFSNSIFRMTVMALIIWIWNKDPGVSIMAAVVYFLTMHHLVQNGLAQVASTGIVSPEVAIMISGGGGPSIKSSGIIQAEADLMQASVNSKPSGFLTPPQAVMSGPVSTAAVAGIASIPSGTPATSASMMASSPEGGLPQAFTPDDVHDFAVAPK